MRLAGPHAYPRSQAASSEAIAAAATGNSRSPYHHADSPRDRNAPTSRTTPGSRVASKARNFARTSDFGAAMSRKRSIRAAACGSARAGGRREEDHDSARIDGAAVEATAGSDQRIGRGELRPTLG